MVERVSCASLVIIKYLARRPLSVLARVDTYQDDDQATFANEFISLTAWASSDAGDPFLAQSAVGGLDDNNEFQNDASRCPQQ